MMVVLLMTSTPSSSLRHCHTPKAVASPAASMGGDVIKMVENLFFNTWTDSRE